MYKIIRIYMTAILLFYGKIGIGVWAYVWGFHLCVDNVYKLLLSLGVQIQKMF